VTTVLRPLFTHNLGHRFRWVMTLVIAHRGSHETVPENTPAAFAAASANGADMVELDVRRTADGQLAIFHDAQVGRTPLSRLSLAELRSASGVAVPVLEDVLTWAAEAGMGLDVELKEDGYVEAVAPLLDAFPGRLLVTSFLDPVLAQLAALAPDLRRGLLLSLTSMGAVKRVRQCHAHAAVIEMKLLRGPVLDELVEAGLDALVWDFMPARAGHGEWLGDARIRGFITDDVRGTRDALVMH
jgi:glycerophosphoryl diester phosphodiesterase